MKLIAIVVLAQLAAPARQTLPVLSFPEPDLDDTAAYGGYRTRLFRDAAGNTLQIYLEPAAGRVVHLLANAADQSIAFTVRDARGAARLDWDGAGAAVAGDAAWRSLEHRLVADAPLVHIGAPLLGSMRVERDFQYAGRGRAPFGGPAFPLAEVDGLVSAVARLDDAERARHLELLGATDLAALRGRLRPALSTRSTDTSWTARFVQPSLDGRDSLALELRVDPRLVRAARVGDSIALRARSGGRVPFTVRVSTSATPLTPLAREEIFTPAFLAFLAESRGATDLAGGARARRMERQVRGVELLVSREKLMAGLPAYATYFGRDMLVSALMMRSIWRDEMSEFAIAAALRKLSPAGEVSHEEALGGQAVRERAAEYPPLVDAALAARREGRAARADSLLERARLVLRDLSRTRENYHMIDDELQLPILVARWLDDPDVPAARKRAFLADSADGEPRLRRLLRELALVARMTAPYAVDPSAGNLVSFPPRELPGAAPPDAPPPDAPRWSSASWRDSGAGYAGGRFAMDVNAIWAPHAVESVGRILERVRMLGFSADSLAAAMPELADGTPLGFWVRDPLALRVAAETWRGASRHFLVRLAPDELRARVDARLAAMSASERAWGRAVLAATGADRDSLEFLALALDADGRPIGVANSDVATGLFLDATAGGATADSGTTRLLRDVRLFVRPWPVGLLVDSVGPVVANDAYAPPAVWAAFERDRYHGPRVVWGREVNLFLLGVAGQLARGDGRDAAGELRAALRRVQDAVEASGFHSELWSWRVERGRAEPVRYGTGSDVQLWSTTDLAVRFALAGLER